MRFTAIHWHNENSRSVRRCRILRPNLIGCKAAIGRKSCLSDPPSRHIAQHAALAVSDEGEPKLAGDCGLERKGREQQVAIVPGAAHCEWLVLFEDAVLCIVANESPVACAVALDHSQGVLADRC